MIQFKVEDKVVAPTVFKGIGKVTELQELLNKNRYIVVYDGVREWCFTEDGKLITFSTGTCDRDVIMLHAEIPALYHYTEYDDNNATRD